MEGKETSSASESKIGENQGKLMTFRNSDRALIPQQNNHRAHAFTAAIAVIKIYVLTIFRSRGWSGGRGRRRSGNQLPLALTR